MDVCYFLVDVQEITISPYFGVKQGYYFIPFLSKDPVYIYQVSKKNVPLGVFCPSSKGTFFLGHPVYLWRPAM